MPLNVQVKLTTPLKHLAYGVIAGAVNYSQHGHA